MFWGGRLDPTRNYSHSRDDRKLRGGIQDAEFILKVDFCDSALGHLKQREQYQ
jgi:hypothetical protein